MGIVVGKIMGNNREIVQIFMGDWDKNHLC